MAWGLVSKRVSQRALFGTETEYAVTALDREGNALPGVAGLIATRAALRPHLPATESGVFLANGGRFYTDVGGHPEYASPETVNPWDGVRYALAGDRLLTEFVQEVVETTPRIAGLVLRKGNVDYAHEGITWASHENYLCRLAAADLRPRLVPHLISRIVFTGAGGFDPFDMSCPRFVLSPRALFIRQIVALATSAEGRALVDTRDQPHCTGFHRQHIVCGDALRGHLGSFLRLGTTALVIALIEAGCDREEDVRLSSPLAALATVARDVSLSRALHLVGGQATTALAIQRHYLTQARTHLDVLPDWGAAVCRVWQDTLERLELGVDAVSDRLDWAIKHTVYRDRAARRGLPWWSFGGSHDQGPAPPSPACAPAEWRAELCEIDTRFGQLHPPGLFDSLDAAGVLRHGLPGIDDVSRALESPPAGSRASIRGGVIAQRGDGGEPLACSWDGVRDILFRMRLDLSDPFCQEEIWCDSPVRAAPRPTLASQIFELARLRPTSTTEQAIRELVATICAADGQALRRELAPDAIPFNCRAIELRREGRLAEAEWLMRAALAVDIEARSLNHAKVAHRRNNLATVLMMQGRLDEACEQVGLAWRALAFQYDLTSVRVLTMRLTLALLRDERPGLYIGQLKTHLTMRPLPDYADVVPRWEFAPVLDAIAPRLTAADASLLGTIVAVLNGDALSQALQEQPRWPEPPRQALDVQWPDAPVRSQDPAQPAGR
jgi:hypothetical protein